MQNILIYGFGPFGAISRNPTEDVVRDIEALALPGIAITAEVLPVSFRAVRRRLSELLRADRFSLVLGFGVAAGIGDIQVEREAYNLADAIEPDIEGETPRQEPIVPGAPQRVRATVDVDRLVGAARATGAPCTPSSEQDGYVCNYAFFLSLVLAATDGAASRVGFVHVPLTRKFPGTDDLPTLAQESVNRAAEAITRAAILPNAPVAL